MLRPYWVQLARRPEPTPLNIGIGVTAASEEESRAMVLQAVEDADIVSVSPVLDATELDQGHVVPNMGNLLVRGIWFPLGY